MFVSAFLAEILNLIQMNGGIATHSSLLLCEMKNSAVHTGRVYADMRARTLSLIKTTIALMDGALYQNKPCSKKLAQLIR